jgi:hypothetical protein
MYALSTLKQLNADACFQSWYAQLLLEACVINEACARTITIDTTKYIYNADGSARVCAGLYYEAHHD